MIRVEVSNLVAANFNFQSFSLRKIQRNVLRKVRAEEKESKNYLRVNLEKTQCSRKREVHLSTHRVNLEKLSAVAVGERREKRRKKEVEASFESSVLCV